VKRATPAVGSTYGKLTVLGPAPVDAQGRTRARVHCACGVECDAVIRRLIAGETISCGCVRGHHSRPAEIAASFAPGAVHGLLTVVRSEGTGRNRVVHCTCACGRQAEILYPYALRSGFVRSCGCLAGKRGGRG